MVTAMIMRSNPFASLGSTRSGDDLSLRVAHTQSTSELAGCLAPVELSHLCTSHQRRAPNALPSGQMREAPGVLISWMNSSYGVTFWGSRPSSNTW